MNNDRQHSEQPVLGACPGEGPADDDGMVGRLVQLADAGPEIPKDGADRIRQAIRPEWRREVRARSRRRLVWGFGSVAAAGVLLAIVTSVFLTGPASPVEADAIARVAVIVGAVDVVSPEGESSRLVEAEIGAEILPGSVLTTGASDRAAFVLAGGQSLRLDVDSAIELETSTTLTLAGGAVYIDSGDVAGRGVEVRTTFGSTREIGTQFEVRRNEAGLVVRVREGSVVLSRDTEDIVIDQGTALTVAPDGSRDATAIPTYDPAWAWTQSVASAFVMEGRTAAELLDWVSRETGLWISFASPEVEAAAREAVLHGTLDGVTPSEAPELVLPGCGLRADRSPGALTVVPIDGGG